MRRKSLLYYMPSSWPPAILKTCHKSSNVYSTKWLFGCGANEQGSQTYFRKLDCLSTKIANTVFVQYVQQQYREYIVNKMKFSMFNFDGCTRHYIGAAGGFDKVNRIPKVFDATKNDYIWEEKTFEESPFYVRTYRPRSTEDLGEAKLEAGYVETFDIVHTKNKRGRYRKFLSYVWYPKCTKPLKTTQIWDAQRTVSDVVALMEPKDFDKNHSPYVMLGFGPFDPLMFPDTNQEQESLDVCVQFEWSLKVYYTLFKRDDRVY